MHFYSLLFVALLAAGVSCTAVEETTTTTIAPISTTTTVISSTSSTTALPDKDIIAKQRDIVNQINKRDIVNMINKRAGSSVHEDLPVETGPEATLPKKTDEVVNVHETLMPETDKRIRRAHAMRRANFNNNNGGGSGSNFNNNNEGSGFGGSNFNNNNGGGFGPSNFNNNNGGGGMGSNFNNNNAGGGMSNFNNNNAGGGRRPNNFNNNNAGGGFGSNFNNNNAGGGRPNGGGHRHPMNGFRMGGFDGDDDSFGPGMRMGGGMMGGGRFNSGMMGFGGRNMFRRRRNTAGPMMSMNSDNSRMSGMIRKDVGDEMHKDMMERPTM